MIFSLEGSIPIQIVFQYHFYAECHVGVGKYENKFIKKYRNEKSICRGSQAFK